jgi:cytochrome c-type biogenesis protein CcmH/NrfG
MNGGTRAYLLVAKTQLAMEEPGEAVKAYEEALKSDPANETANKGLARARAELAKSK